MMNQHENFPDLMQEDTFEVVNPARDTLLAIPL